MPIIFNALRIFIINIVKSFSGYFLGSLAKIFLTFGQKVAIFVLFTGLLVSVTVTYYTLANNIISGLHKTIPAIVLDVWGWVMPDNAVPCLIAIFSARILKWTYNRYKQTIEQKMIAMIGK